MKKAMFLAGAVISISLISMRPQAGLDYTVEIVESTHKLIS
jgi:hypothetical protein